MNRFLFLVLLISILLAAYAGTEAQVYRWVDEKGVIHFTDDLSQVPERYRASVTGEGKISEPSLEKLETEPKPSKTKGSAYTDTAGRGEAYWRARVKEWKEKLVQAEERVEALRSKYNELTEKYNASRHSGERLTIRNQREIIKEEIDKYRAQIEEAKAMLEEKIPEEAELFKARPEWIRP